MRPSVVLLFVFQFTCICRPYRMYITSLQGGQFSCVSISAVSASEWLRHLTAIRLVRDCAPAGLGTFIYAPLKNTGFRKIVKPFRGFFRGLLLLLCVRAPDMLKTGGGLGESQFVGRFAIRRGIGRIEEIGRMLPQFTLPRFARPRLNLPALS